MVVVGNRVFDAGHLAFDGFVVDFVVGDGGLEVGVPVDEAFAAEDEAVLEHLEEGFADGFGADVIEGEAGAVPVAACADGLELVEDAGAELFLPFPDAADEFFAAEVVAVFVFFFEDGFFDDGLGGDAGMVDAGHPEGVVALHAVVAGEDVLNGAIDGVAEVEGAGDVGRGDDDGEAFFQGGLIGDGVEGLGVEPFLVDGFFDGLGVVLRGRSMVMIYSNRSFETQRTQRTQRRRFYYFFRQ